MGHDLPECRKFFLPDPNRWGSAAGRNERAPKNKKSRFEDEAVEMLAKFGFQDPKRILKSYPFELSGGMQQRVGVAAAMLLKPKILLADEPTSALDVSIQKQVVEQMKMIREQYGTTILIVTHNIGVIRAMADSMLVLKDGKWKNTERRRRY